MAIIDEVEKGKRNSVDFIMAVFSGEAHQHPCWLPGISIDDIGGDTVRLSFHDSFNGVDVQVDFSLKRINAISTGDCPWSKMRYYLLAQLYGALVEV